MAMKIPFFNKKQPNELLHHLDDHIPEHIAIIMDGNGRWAREAWDAQSSGP